MMVIPQYYEFLCPVKIVSGLKALSHLPYEMDQLGVKRALVVTDQGVVGAGLIKHLHAAMEGSAGELAAVYDQTPPDSSVKVVNAVANLYKEKNCDCLIALGGGSCMDTAKGANIVISEGTDDLMKFQGSDRLTKPTQPMIAIPTTAGTGSEVTLAAVIADKDKGVKMPFVSDRLYPRVAIIDPKMTMTMPPKITAATGMDALTHAVEAYMCLQKNPISDAFALGAIQLVFENLPKAVEKGDDEHARLAMANAALIAGIAFSNAMVGIVHALAHATGGVAHVPHGVANAIYLPFGMEHNLNKVPQYIAQMAPYMGVKDLTGSDKDKALRAIEAVRDLTSNLNRMSGMPVNLKDAGVNESQLDKIADGTLDDGSCMYNPEDVLRDDVMAILNRAFK